MNGRYFFYRFNFVFKFLIAILRIFPMFIRSFIFDLLSGFPGKIGVILRYISIKSIVKNSGVNIYIGRWVVIKNAHNISLGNNVSIHDYCYLDGGGCLSIGNDVSIAHNCSILTFEHSFSNALEPIKYQPIHYGKVIISNNVWLGCGCRVLSGSVIHSRSVVGANSVIKNNIDGGLYVGTPAKKVKDI